MNKRISKNGINRIAKEYNSMLQGEGLKYSTPKCVFDSMVNMLAAMLADDNENFDRQKFFDAVYKEEVK
mgnify:CR=1 FL=1